NWWNDAEDRARPFGFDPGKTSEMQFREPLEGEIAAARHEAVQIRRLEIINEPAERMREDEIDPADRPYEHGDERPEADRAVQVPVHALPAAAQPHGQAAPPLARALPPDDGAGQTEQREQNRAGAVDEAAVHAAEQIVVQADEPVDRADGPRPRLAEVRAVVRIEQVLLLRGSAVHPDIDRRSAPPASPDFFDREIGERSQRRDAKLI